MSLVTKVFWNGCASASSAIGRLLAGVIVARQLGPDMMGQFSYLLWATEFLVLVMGFGLPQALVYFLAKRQWARGSIERQQLLRWVGRAYVALSIIVCISMYLFSRHVILEDTYMPPTLAGALAILVAFQLWAGLTQSSLIGMQDFKTNTKIAVASSLLLLCGQGLGSIYFGVIGAIYGTAAAYAVGASAFLFVLTRDSKSEAQSNVSDQKVSRPPSAFFTYGLNAWMAAIVSAVAWGRAEVFFIEHSSGSGEVGYFAVGLVFSGLIVQMVALVSGTLLPHFSQLIDAGETRQVNRDYRRLSLFIAILTMPISLGGLALMPELMRLVFGSEYEPAVPVARWLIATGLWAFATVGSSVIYGVGDARVIFRWGLIAALMLASGCYLFTPDYAAAGAGAVRWLVNGIMIAIGAHLLRYRYGQPFPGWSLAKTLVAALICASSARIAADYGSSDLVGLLLGVATGAMAYLLSLRILNVIASDDVATIRGLINRLPGFVRLPANFILGVVVTR